jgi:hypothetical protein
MQAKQELSNRLDASIKDALGKAKMNYRLAYLCYIVAFLAGAAGSVIVALDSKGAYRAIAAIAGILPTLALSALSTFKLSARADWHYDRARELKKIWRHLLNASDGDVTKLIDWWNNTEDALEKRWPKFGVLPHSEGTQTLKNDE